MEQYILKSALVAEIKKRGYYAQSMSDNAINGSMQQFYDGMKECCQELSVFLDTLEVKEVDFDKELNKYFITNNLIAADIQFEPVTQMKKCAQYFFELGMRFSAIGSDCIEGIRGYYETTTK